MNTLRLTSLLILTTAVAAAATTCLAAEEQAQAAATPGGPLTAEQVFAHYVQARGGKAALEKTATIAAKGTVEGLEGAGVTGSATFEFVTKAPDKCLMVITDSSGPFVRQAVDGATGWRAVRTDLGDLAPNHLALLQGLVRIHMATQLSELFPKITLKGKESVQDREANVIEAVMAQGQIFKLYFEMKTGLLLRIETEISGDSLRYDWEDFRDVAGVKMPYKISAQEGPFSYAMRFTEIKRNTPVDDARFKKPNS